MQIVEILNTLTLHTCAIPNVKITLFYSHEAIEIRYERKNRTTILIKPKNAIKGNQKEMKKHVHATPCQPVKFYLNKLIVS